ncbi:MAG: TIGR03936 family radical SAM-associated protein [Eubacteriales bacterium]
MKVRIKFSRHGVMKFIGHLDIMRYFQKAIRRAELDIAYSTGFSPHQIMSFAAPLGVGICSNGEYLDVEITSNEGATDMINRLNATMAHGICVESVKALPETVGNAMASVAAASYTITWKKEEDIPVNLSAQVEAFKKLPEVNVVKKTKKGNRDLNLQPYIYKMTTDGTSLSLFVDATSANNVKPALLMEGFYEFIKLEYNFNLFQITREDTFTNIGTEASPNYVPLDAVGEDF